MLFIERTSISTLQQHLYCIPVEIDSEQMLCNRYLYFPCPLSFKRSVRPINHLIVRSLYGISHLQTMEFDEINKHKSSLDFLTHKPYTPPSWASHLNPLPSHHFSLGHLPTPIHPWKLPNLPNGTELWLKVLHDELLFQYQFHQPFS